MTAGGLTLCWALQSHPQTFPWLISCSTRCLGFAVLPPGLAEQGAQSPERRRGKLGTQNQLRPRNALEEGRKTLSCSGWLLNASFLPSHFWAVLRSVPRLGLMLQHLLIPTPVAAGEIFQRSVLFISLCLAPNQDCCCCFSGSLNLFWSHIGSGSCCGSSVAEL